MNGESYPELVGQRELGVMRSRGLYNVWDLMKDTSICDNSTGREARERTLGLNSWRIFSARQGVWVSDTDSWTVVYFQKSILAE